MEVLSFDISGKFAHFRKFHGNNTAMSYSIPPRTTIMGILGALLGEEKDSYYKRFNSGQLNIGIRVLNEIRKSYHRVNFLKIKGLSDFRGQQGRIQTPFEIVTGSNLKKDLVSYRVYLSEGENADLYGDLKHKLLSRERVFNLSLGIAGFSAFIDRVHVSDSLLVEVQNNWVDIHSACNSEQVSEIDFPEDPEIKFNHIEEELLPADFIGGDSGRELKRMNRVLFSTRPFPLHVKLSGKYCSLQNGNEEENIQFLEYAGILAQ